MRKLTLMSTFLLMLWLLFVQDAFAERGGGSIGGRSGYRSSPSGSSSSSSSSSSRSSSSSSSSSRSSSSYRPSSSSHSSSSSSYSSSDPESSARVNTIIIVIFSVVGGGFLFILIYLFFIHDPTGERKKRRAAALDKSAVFLRLSTCFVATEKSLQTGLQQLAENADTSTPEGQWEVLRTALSLMTPSVEGATRVRFEVKDELSQAQSLSELEAAGIDLRSRFDEETIRTDEKGVRTQEATDEDEEVAEFVVVSLVITFRGPRPQTTQVTNAFDLLGLLEDLLMLDMNRLLGIEIVWDPVSPDEELTTRDLDEKYPDLVPM